METMSGIVRMGLINSGMFDALDLNFKVPNMHLVGDNNVGKTSLIEAIQFLYFPDLREMRFSKSLGESLAFYFRPEGSYILFTVRTVRSLLRTVGVYGTGSADSRRVFVFDGEFDLSDFLDERQCVAPLQTVWGRMAGRRWWEYQRADDHERGLIGEHSNDAANVQLFDLDREQFRLLRALLQNLLRLDRIAAGDIRRFLHTLVESAGAKTRIDVARDVTQRCQQVRNIRANIHRLQKLKQLVDAWTAAQQRVLAAHAEERTTRGRLAATGHSCIVRLQRHATMHDEQAMALSRQLHDLEQQQHEFANRLAEAKAKRRELERTLEQIERLRSQCAGVSEDEARTERNSLAHQLIDLQNQQEKLHHVDATQIEQRLQRARRAYDALQRRLASRTIDQLLAESNLSDDHRALARFLFSDRLRGLPAHETVQDAERLLQTVADAAARIDAQGAFVGFGVSVARALWRSALDDDEPLNDQLERQARDVAALERELDLARNQMRIAMDMRRLQQRIHELDELVQNWRRLNDIERESGGESSLRAALAHNLAEQDDLRAHQEQVRARMGDCREREIEVRTHINHLTQRIDAIQRAMASLAPVDPLDADDLDGADDDDVFRRFEELGREHADRLRDMKRSDDELRSARAPLEEMYDRDGDDRPFDEWLATKQEQINAIPRLEAQLREQYANLITQVKGELETLLTAFDIVRERIAELNQIIRPIAISNIARIELAVRESDVISAIRQVSRLQLDLFATPDEPMAFAEAERLIDDHVASVFHGHGRELSLDQLYHLEFRVAFNGTNEQRSVSEIHAFESNGTAIGVKIVIYLGLIRLVQSRKRTIARIPFFLDEAGSLSSNNVRQLIRYCRMHHFLPIFASPTIRSEISHSYLLCRRGARSVLMTELTLTEPEEMDAAAEVA